MSVGTTLLNKKDFRILMKSTLEDHLTLGHPLFKYLMDENNPNEALLKFTTLQGYQLTKHFLTYIECLFFYCPLPKHKRALLHNMYEEETGRLSNTKNHVVLMQDFIKAIGISDDERDTAVALHQTQALIDYRMKPCKDPELYHIGAAAVLVASEGQNLESVGDQARHNILGKVYGLTEKDLLFFSVHQEEDVGHVQQGLALLADLCTTPQMQAEAIDAIDRTCRLFYGMYQGVYEHFGYDKLDQTKASKDETVEA
ncbi:iron-containing redox enzyme family protein [Photobacterium rosenbergii]|uniref:Iron-containing redox enzyme family protein n=1 Tax=Photobacterium rosenbergii TaxID=294936 RepID=A0ABU3ZHZ0_9GAMM|nr:iron-containing redox enzyme family protein [Photobacterium rosenbergii]MDV5169701.1 iron-containing redox enzyme family protein [Photobacterium rosenbergii]